MSGALRRRRHNHILPPHSARSIFGVPEGVMMAIEVPQNEEISKGGKGVDSAIRQKRANRGSINIKKREQREVCLVRS